MPILFLLIFLLVPSIAFGASDKCYPGLDCPQDLPPDAPGRINPPPIRPERTPPVRQRVQQNCSNPQAAAIQNLYSGLLTGKQTTPCTLSATHCCFNDGSAVPLQDPGSLPFAEYCHVQRNYWGFPQTIIGMGCRR